MRQDGLVSTLASVDSSATIHSVITAVSSHSVESVRSFSTFLNDCHILQTASLRVTQMLKMETSAASSYHLSSLWLMGNGVYLVSGVVGSSLKEARLLEELFISLSDQSADAGHLSFETRLLTQI